MSPREESGRGPFPRNNYSYGEVAEVTEIDSEAKEGIDYGADEAKRSHQFCTHTQACRSRSRDPP